ncbi:MAG: endonuclease MutS2 [Myxococcota bacterium]
MLASNSRLELDDVRGALLERVRTPLGTNQAQQLAPFAEPGPARARIEAVRQARALIDLAEPPPVWGAEDVAASLSDAEKGLMLEGGPLRAIAETMSVGATVRRHLLAHEAVAPALYGLAAGLDDLSRVARDIKQCFEPDGTLADHASPDLGPLRSRVRALQESIRAKLSELLRDTKLQDYLQDVYFTIRNDRHVLPIKASYKNEVRGIVHDASGSGQTVFIEPQALVDLGNRLKIAESEQKEEERRILSELTLLAAENADQVREIMHVVGICDFLTAAAQLSIDLRCVPVIPHDGPGFDLRRARHPLLVLQTLAPPPTQADGETDAPAPAPKPRVSHVVGNDFGLQKEQQVLVITGPNTGGKTVAMKTIGLFALMVKCGLHLPCDEGSSVGWYDRVDVAIGDMQSIADNLSTFAAHMKALVRILEMADATSLVLIDEIASDTDPTQGQALAQAVLERLADAGGHVVVTTHFERLKAVPFADPRFRNAGVGFDATALKPTYRVTLDVPQGSSGFDIAQALGLPEVIVDRARSLTGDGAQELERIIKAVEDQSGALEQARIELEKAKAEAAAAQAKAEAKQAELQRAIDKVKAGAQTDLVAEIESRQQEVKTMIARLQAATADSSASESMRMANQAADKLGKLHKEEREKLPETEVAPKRVAKRVDRVKVGDWVRVPKLGRDGDVVAIDGRQAHVSIGNMRIRVAVADLEVPHKPRPKRTARPAPKEFKPRTTKVKTEGDEISITEEIDLRGSTVDEGIQRLEGFLDHHYNTVTTHVRVVHGHGTGALREAVREHLKRSGYVKSVRAGGQNEGGDGVTMVALG